MKHVSLNGDEGSIIYSSLTSENVDAVIVEQIAYFENLDQNFEWKYYAHDKPEGLLEHLRRHGFTLEEREALLVLDLQHLPGELKQPTSHDIRLLQHPEDLKDVLTVETSVWGGDQTSIISFLTETRHTRPKCLRVYVAYVDNKPASSAWMFLNESSQFASL